MSIAGYSGKPLAAKLGLKPGMRIAVIEPPRAYEEVLGASPAGVMIDSPRGGGPYDLVHLFVRDAAGLDARLPAALGLVAPGGALWISWPKKASALFRDLTEDAIRAAVLPTGFVDVKVAAVDEEWSGLKFLRRRSER
ncbi:MAG TPA: hypothetical protein VKS60_01685 [Stellaceae bacterium]|nr:hypothetical protein [Stellaceae bacterium]